MNKAELMIGNLIVYKDQVGVVESIGPDKLSLRSIDEKVDLVTNPIDVISYDECSGIPLNEEWMLALGLIADPDNAVYEELWYNFPDERFSIKLNTSAPHKVELEYIIILKMVSFVHELQNLYFILTGEDLKVSTYPYGVYARR